MADTAKPIDLDEFTAYMPGNAVLLKCPLYCPSTCLVQHHPLLVAILNCFDTPEIELMENKLQMLSNMVNKFMEGMHWSGNDPIPDVVERYRAPMLHWVATLGRVGVAIWLIGHNISDPTTRSLVYNGETALHRALLCLQETCPAEAGHKFVQLLSVLEPALSMPDNNGNTPLHVCCARLKIGLQKADYYRECLHYMLYELSNEKKVPRHQTVTVLNMKNIKGDTALHFLAAHDKHLQEIRSLVQLGSDFMLENNLGQTPYDVAIKHNCSAVYTFFKTWNGAEVQQVIPASKTRRLKTGTPEQHKCADEQLRQRNSCQYSVLPPSSSSTVVKLEKTHNLTEPAKESSSSGEENATLAPDTNSEQVPANKRRKLETPEQLVQLSDGSYEPDTRKPSDATNSPVLSLPDLFPDDENDKAQAFFEDTVIKYIYNLKSKKQSKKTKITLSEFVMLPACLDLSDLGGVEMVRKTLTEADPAVVTQYLAYMKETGSSYQPIIDYIQSTCCESLSNLQLANKCEASIQQLFKDEQKKQETLVSEIMEKFDCINKLNREEKILNGEMRKIKERSTATNANNSNLRERLKNCEAALDVLKRLYHEALTKKSKT